ncbi:Predicted transcriptional regulator [Saccharopolyspora antimicrobica]|uniref:Transcriptional regulator n=2 Tax=Saccharopolyspora TaxID=1835 RepID=A0A1I4YT76_9PSEU|nr:MULTISPECIES: XRE family transcriptional regulator [Saccharopolyspora]RKT82809.1 putative transcriptional regulator [Saccharopolyspora antimicrobica]SEG92867.1 Predicted transcriptional regulator [Saccharopolyspora kobensis]SFD40877.1 Predicted transcriptional regulator [Saccharopolyspora kobensis]SFN41235.1 Predicted transcriptional regulator [Saccharopolyspora antimicrobica]
MTEFASEEDRNFSTEHDLLVFGQRLRHLRRAAGLTLVELGERVGRAPSQLSLLENGHREPKLSLLRGLADALGTSVDELLSKKPPNRRAELEIAVEKAQLDPIYQRLGVPPLKVGKRVPTEALEHVLALYEELRRRETKQVATPEEARKANAELRRMMREHGNYFPEIEKAAAGILDKVGYHGGPLSEGQIQAIATHLGFGLRFVTDLPRSVRSVTDLKNRRIFLRRESLGMHSPRTILLQTLGHLTLGHSQPRDFADFLRQRVEANYFAAAVLVPEQTAVPFLQDAKAERDLAVEDMRDVFSVSYEMAAHRFTNLATQYLDLVCHFVRNDETGIIYKAYENDGLVFPSDATGAIEGQRMCRYWSGRQVFASQDRYSTYYQYTDKPGATHWCVAHVDPSRGRDFAITLGVPYAESRWFRGRDTNNHSKSKCPNGECCQRPPAELASRWEGMVWPSARAHSHVLAALPADTFPGVDEADVYAFVEAHQS